MTNKTLNWVYDDDNKCLCTETQEYSFQIIQIDNSFGAYMVDKNNVSKFGYLNNKLEIACGPGLVCAIGLKPDAAFQSKQEAIDVCLELVRSRK